MGFKEVLDLDCDKAYALGGTDKKSRKPNPTKVEGYFIGSKQIPNKFSKDGVGYLHVFQTENGKEGVFGKTDLNRKMKSVAPGTMTRVTFSGTIPTKFGDMAKYKVEQDETNTIEVSLPSNDSTTAESFDASGDTELAEIDADEVEEPVLPRPAAPARAARTPSAEQQARVQALLSGKK